MSDQRRPAVLQLPAPDVHGTKRTISCEVEGMQGKRLIVTTGEEVRESTPVSIECEDTLLLGEVILSSASNQVWRTEIRVEQILTGLQSLMALRAQLMSDSMAAPLPLMPLGLRN